MAADLTKPSRYKVHTEFSHWPKCFRCSRALERPYPVEHFGVAGREPSRTADGYYGLILEVKCSHGEARRLELENSRSFGAKLWGIAGGMGLTHYNSAESEQRVVIEIPRTMAGVELTDGSYQASASEQLACSRVYAFAPGAKGRHGVVYMPGSVAQRHGLETTVR